MLPGNQHREPRSGLLRVFRTPSSQAPAVRAAASRQPVRAIRAATRGAPASLGRRTRHRRAADAGRRQHALEPAASLGHAVDAPAQRPRGEADGPGPTADAGRTCDLGWRRRPAPGQRRAGSSSSAAAAVTVTASPGRCPRARRTATRPSSRRRCARSTRRPGSRSASSRPSGPSSTGSSRRGRASTRPSTTS